MKKFTEIEAFRHLVRAVKSECDYKGTRLPTVRYTGVVKLHGTNSSIRITPTEFQPQSRNRIINVGSDNNGFAFFCSIGNKEAVVRKFLLDNFPYVMDITVFGEWCGQGIQASVALNQLEKHFVIFAIHDNEADCYYSVDDSLEVDFDALHAQGIYFIHEVAEYTVEIDFNNPEEAADEIEKYTLEVEDSCPWGKYRGVEGTGEGIVWYPTGNQEDTSRWFKSKGLKHKKTKDKRLLDIDPVKVENIHNLVDAILPEWRLEQGISALKENGTTIEPKSTGEYLKWIHKDILKEETDVIAANNFEWKEIVSTVTGRARQYWLDYLNKNY